MGYRRLNLFSMIPSVLKSRSTISKAKQDKIDGNLSGDGMQNGGVLVVSKGGDKVLLDFRQVNPGDHVPLEDVLKALGIEGQPSSLPEGASSGKPQVECNDDVCTIKK
ncbi:prostamide/prostaglandin F synthase-like [Ptychodera flava]|uniref:prostamide/prostaglandin F synthase-like n=1 Tax=Ptychodera flava TaxID=63121 RepID=UPI00396A54A9